MIIEMVKELALRLFLLGPFHYDSPSRKKPSIGRKTRSLLAYLAAEDRPVSRHALSDMFCQRARDPAGALRWHLSRIRRAFGGQVLVEDGNGIAINPVEASIDCLQFDAIIGAGLDHAAQLELEAQLARYRGAFLEGLHLPDSPEYELWLLGRRAHYAERYSRGLQTLLDQLSREGEYKTAIHWAQQLVSHDPLLEEGHMRLIWLYDRTGQRQAALEQYELCRDLLAGELAVEPTPQLVALHERVLSGKPSRDLAAVAPVKFVLDTARQASPFVGRTAELGQLGDAHRNALAGQPAVVLVEAEAGGGKTRLVEEFVRRQEAIFLIGRGFESMRAFSYRPWIEILESYLDRMPPDLPESFSPFWLDQLAVLLPDLRARMDLKPSGRPDSASIQAEPLFTAVADILLRLPRKEPMVMLLDDLQWVDEASFQLFHFLSQRLQRPQVQPTLLIGAFRGEEVANNPELGTLLQDLRRTDHTQISLGPLDEQAIDQIVASLWPALPDGYRPHIVRKLAHTAGGNPFFITEVVQELSASSEVPDSLPVPSSVRDLIQRRLRQLNESSRQVVEAIAILGLPATVEESQSTSARSKDETHHAIDTALQREILIPVAQPDRPMYDFQHDLVREAVIQQLSDIRCRLLHARAGQALEAAGEAPARLAYHWASAGQPDKEALHSLAAGEAAAKLHAHEEARRFLNRFLELEPTGLDRPKALLALGRIDHLTGNWEKAQGHYEAALELAEAFSNLPILARCLTQIGLLSMHRGLYERAKSELLRAETLLEKLHDLAELGNARGTRAVVLWYLGEYAEALRLLEDRRQIAESIGDTYSASIAIANMGIVYWSQGELEKAAECYQQKLDFDRAADDRLSLSKGALNIGLVYRDMGDYRRALNSFAEKLRLDSVAGDQLGVAFALENIGEIFTRTGDWRRAEKSLLESLRLALEMGSLQVVSIAIARLAELYFERNNLMLALRLATQATDIAREIKLKRNLCLYLLVQAKILHKLDKFQEAEPLAKEAAVVAEAVNRDAVAYEAALLQIQLSAALRPGETDRAIGALEKMLDAWPQDARQADIHYQIWKLNPEREASRTASTSLYRALYEQTPNEKFRTRYAALTGEPGPSPTDLPEVPEAEHFEPAHLEALLDQATELMTSLLP